MQSCSPRYNLAGFLLGTILVITVGSIATVESSAAPHQPVAEGASLFTSSGCPQCHGPTGLGTEKAPSLRDVPKHLNAEQTHTQIHDGGKLMPPFGEALTEEQIAALVEFLQAKNGWKLVEASALKDSPPPSPQ